MMKKLELCLILCISACAVQPDPTQDPSEATGDNAGLTQDSTEAAHQASESRDPGACKLAEQLGYDKLAVRSCLTGTPVNGDGMLAPAPTPDTATTQACHTYTGACSGVNGCSVARGEGWVKQVCGFFIYSWMTICDGQPTGWGANPCLF